MVLLFCGVLLVLRWYSVGILECSAGVPLGNVQLFRLSKARMEKHWLWNRHFKYTSSKNFLSYENAESKYNNLLKQSKKNYIKDTSNKWAATRKISAKKEQEEFCCSGVFCCSAGVPFSVFRCSWFYSMS